MSPHNKVLSRKRVQFATDMQVDTFTGTFHTNTGCHSVARNNLEMVYSIDTLAYSYVCIDRLPTCLTLFVT